MLDPVGNRRTLSYDAADRLNTITDEASGRILSLVYTAEGRIDYVIGPVLPGSIPDGIWVDYDYDEQGFYFIWYVEGLEEVLGTPEEFEITLPGLPI